MMNMKSDSSQKKINRRKVKKICVESNKEILIILIPEIYIKILDGFDSWNFDIIY